MMVSRFKLRVILSAGSNFLGDIFSTCDPTNMFIYLKGIARTELESIMNFLYNGEAYVEQEELEAILETAKKLKIKGLQTNIEDNRKAIDAGFEDKSGVAVFDRKPLVENTVDESMEKSMVTLQDQDIGLIDNQIVGDDNLIVLDELPGEKGHGMFIENFDSFWVCKICGKTSKQKGNLKSHVELHFPQDEINTCNLCEKQFSTRLSLKSHKINVHSKLYSCKTCGKINMNKMALQYHKKKCTRVPMEQSNML